MIRHLTAALAGEPFLAMRYTFGRLKVYHDGYAGPDALQPEQTLRSRLGNSDEISIDRRTTRSGLADPARIISRTAPRLGLCQSLGRSALEPADYKPWVGDCLRTCEANSLVMCKSHGGQLLA